MRRRREQAPFQAIADLPYFTGREREMQELKENLLADHQVVIYGLRGMGGVGKTALAAHIAYQLSPHFPDGVLWARVDTADPMSVLSTFAEAYQRDVTKYADLDSRSRVVRDILAHKRTLIVLDNVQDSQQIKPLLPPTTGSCAVLITTRRASLSAMLGASWLHLGPFDQQKDEALDLFLKILGPERVRQERAALSEIARLLGHLPLAVAIAAGHIASRTDQPASDFLQRVREQRKRLGELVYEDYNVRLSFDPSYVALSPDEQRFFAALSVFDGEDFGIKAAAYVTETGPESAQENLNHLYGLSLVQEGRPSRYRLHPLLRDYAREKISEEEGFARMVEFFVQYIESHEKDYGALDLETSKVLAALEAASERGMQAALVRGSNAFYHFLEIRGLYDLAETHLKRAERAARSLDDPSGLTSVWLNLGQIANKRGDYARAKEYLQEGLILAREIGHSESISALLNSLGTVAFSRGAYDQAEAYLQESLALAREIGDRERISNLLQRLGTVASSRTDYAQAKEYFQASLTLAREIGNRAIIGATLMNLGIVAEEQGNYAQAETFYQKGLTIAREMDHREQISTLLQALGVAALDQGDHARAEGYFQEGLTIAREIGHRERISALLANLGLVADGQEKYTQAERYFQESLSLAREIGHRWLTGNILDAWGELYLKQQKINAARATLREALEIAHEVGSKDLIAHALYGLARIAAAQGNLIEARRQGQESLAICEMTGYRRMEEIKAWLAELSTLEPAGPSE